MTTTIVVGVDGGGSKTLAIVADESGAEIVRVEGPGSAVRPGEAERSGEIIAALITDALAASDMTHVVPKVVCVGVAGWSSELPLSSAHVEAEGGRSARREGEADRRPSRARASS